MVPFLLLYLFLFIFHTEKDKNGDVLWTWTYPKVEKSFQALLLRKCPLNTGASQTVNFCYGQFSKKWYHYTTVEVSENDKLPKV